MNSDAHRFLTWLLVACLPGCAGFVRGEVWDDDEATTGAAAEGGDDGDDGDDGGATTATSSPGDGSAGDDSGGSDSGGPSGPSFQSDILPILRAGCERCHSADGAANNTSFLLNADDQAAYETTLEFVDLDAPSSSRILTKTAGKGHTGGVIYDDRSSEYETILAWIQDGAAP